MKENLGHERGFCDVYRIPDLGRSRGVFAPSFTTAGHISGAGWEAGIECALRSAWPSSRGIGAIRRRRTASSCGDAGVA